MKANNISVREREILQVLVKGLSCKEIAAVLRSIKALFGNN
jgi:DNA-binding NarL/FixJ family response regulator